MTKVAKLRLNVSISPWRAGEAAAVVLRQQWRRSDQHSQSATLALQKFTGRIISEMPQPGVSRKETDLVSDNRSTTHLFWVTWLLESSHPALPPHSPQSRGSGFPHRPRLKVSAATEFSPWSPRCVGRWWAECMASWHQSWRYMWARWKDRKVEREDERKTIYKRIYNNLMTHLSLIWVRKAPHLPMRSRTFL